MMKAIILTTINLFVVLAVLFILNRMSGWSVLRRAYRLHGRFSGQRRWFFLSARMGFRHTDPLLGVDGPLFPFRNCLNIAANETGVRLSLFPLFRLFNPPLFIPWDHISARVFRGILATWIELRFREEPRVCLLVYQRVGREILLHSPVPVLESDE